MIQNVFIIDKSSNAQIHKVTRPDKNEYLNNKAIHPVVLHKIGIKASKYWLQMISNVLGMMVSVSNVEQDTGKGTAILALVGLGIKKTLDDFDFLANSPKMLNFLKLIWQFFLL